MNNQNPMTAFHTQSSSQNNLGTVEQITCNHISLSYFYVQIALYIFGILTVGPT